MSFRTVGLAVCVLIASLAASPSAQAVTKDKYLAAIPKKLTKITVDPTSVELEHRHDYRQLLFTGTLSTGETIDITRFVKQTGECGAVAVSKTGLVTPLGDGSGAVKFELGDQSVELAVNVTGYDAPYHPSFITDVQPVLGKLGCNQGTCHGAKDGKNGFKLSLRGYDPVYDIRSLTDDVAGRRFNRAAPEQSLMLLKPAGAVPHQGGVLMSPGESYYEILESWIADGSTFDVNDARAVKIDILPKDATIPLPEMAQQMKVIATYADGTTRDVTSEAFIEPSDIEILSIDKAGLVTALRRGEAAVLARYEGSYAATPIYVMGDRTGYAWPGVPAYNYVDKLVYQKQRKVKVLPSDVCTDAEFVRRLYLDLTGLPPTSEQVEKFLTDERDRRIKRDELVDKLVGNPDFVDHWTNKWADMLQVNAKVLGRGGASDLRKWIRHAVEGNMPYDQFVYDVLTAKGSTRENPPAAYYKTLRDPANTMENTTQLFLSIRFNCNKCHDHPFERWTQDQYYDLAAYFAQVDRRGDPMYKGKTIGGSAVEERQPLVEVIYDKDEGDITHDRTGAITPPKFPYAFADFIRESADQAGAGEKREAIRTDLDWINDSQDNGGVTEGVWDFVDSSKAPVYRGKYSRRQSGEGIRQHYFHQASRAVTMRDGDKLYAYVYLDPDNPPKQLMLQFDDGSWEHRAYWGEALLPFTDVAQNDAGRVRVGDLPESGKWVRLEVDAEKVGLAKGATVQGMSFAQYDGTVYWDAAGVNSRTILPTVAKDANAQSRRERLAAWMTHKENPYFARAYVNRIWSYLLGVGLIEPVDDIRAGNPPTNPELLDEMTRRFVASNFNVRQLMTDICKSRTYQLSVSGNEWNEGDTVNYTKAKARRLPAEVLYDTLHRVTGTVARLPGLPAGSRAAEMVNPGDKLEDGFLDQFGRPPRESACECERTTGVMLGPVMKLIMGPTVNNAIIDPDNAITKLVANTKDDEAVVNSIYMRVLNRPATRRELEASVRLLQTPLDDSALIATRDAIAKSIERLDAEQPVWEEKYSKRADGEVKFNPWFRLGPLQAKDANEAFAKSFFPETKYILLTRPVNGKTWMEREDYKDNTIIKLDGDNSANYMVRLLESPKERKVTLFFGSDDGIRVWLNRKEVHKNKIGRPVRRDDDRVEVTLKEGRNTLLIKINNGYGNTGFFFRSDANLAGAGLPDMVARVFRVPPAERTVEQRRRLTSYFRGKDDEYRRLAEQLVIHEQMSANPRLVGAQDLVWALINSPAFYFNR